MRKLRGRAKRVIVIDVRLSLDKGHLEDVTGSHGPSRLLVFYSPASFFPPYFWFGGLARVVRLGQALVVCSSSLMSFLFFFVSILPMRL